MMKWKPLQDFYQEEKMDFLWSVNSRTSLDKGILIHNSPPHMSTLDYYYAKKGSVLKVLGKKYIFNIATYKMGVDDSYIYEFKYLPDSAYLTYNQDLDIEKYSLDDYIFEKDTYFRICLKRADGENITKSDKPKFLVEGSVQERKAFVSSSMFDKEHERIQNLVKTHHDKNSLKIVLATDTHYAINGVYEQSAYNMRRIFRAIGADAMVHLGDFTDGILKKELTQKYTKFVLSQLPKPYYVCLGNHDSNYFGDAKESMDITEQSRVYLGRNTPYYYKDIKGIRLIFLDCYDNTRVHRYGYTDEELYWLENMLDTISMDIVVFGHDAPLAELDYWSEEVHNGHKLIKILESYNKKAKVIAHFSGHAHSENIYTKKSFPIISIGCNKCEDFTVCKPEGFVTHKRKIGDVSQELFDILVIEDKIYLYRYGAGEDRIINY